MLLVFFGESYKENVSTTDVLMHDAPIETWKTLILLFGSLSEARSYAAIATVAKNAFIIVGGLCLQIVKVYDYSSIGPSRVNLIAYQLVLPVSQIKY